MADSIDHFQKMLSKFSNQYELRELFRRHMSEPNLSFGDYELRQLIATSEKFRLETIKIYLDFNFWIKLRETVYSDTYRGAKDQREVYREIFNNLKRLVKEGKAACPISEPLWNELMNMGNGPKRTGIAQMMDALSFGYALNPDIFDKELENYLACQGKYFKHEYNYIWVKPISLAKSYLSQYIDDIGDVPHKEAFKKALLDILLLTTTFQSLQDGCPKNQQFYKKKVAYKACFTHLKENVYYDIKKPESYEHILKSTVLGYVEYLANEKGLNLVDFHDILYQKKAHYFINVCPSLYIWSAIFCHVMVDRQSKIHENDFFDLQHSSYALGYYDYFFTERSFTAKIKDRGLDKTFNTIVEYRPTEILNIISKM